MIVVPAGLQTTSSTAAVLLRAGAAGAGTGFQSRNGFVHCKHVYNIHAVPECDRLDLQSSQILYDSQSISMLHVHCIKKIMATR